MTTHLDGVEYVGAIGRNIARGILPTVVGFNTDPSNLIYATDGNPASVTGTGVTDTGAGAGRVGELWVDLGSLKTVLVGVRLGMWLTNAGGLIQVTQRSKIGAALYYSGSLCETGGTTEQLEAVAAQIVTADQIGFYFYNSAGNIGNIKIYEVTILEILS